MVIESLESAGQIETPAGIFAQFVDDHKLFPDTHSMAHAVTYDAIKKLSSIQGLNEDVHHFMHEVISAHTKAFPSCDFGSKKIT